MKLATIITALASLAAVQARAVRPQLFGRQLANNTASMVDPASDPSTTSSISAYDTTCTTTPTDLTTPTAMTITAVSSSVVDAVTTSSTSPSTTFIAPTLWSTTESSTSNSSTVDGTSTISTTTSDTSTSSPAWPTTTSAVDSEVGAISTSTTSEVSSTTCVEVVTSVRNPTLTYTMGTGSTQSVITTTLHITETITRTLTTFVGPSGEPMTSFVPVGGVHTLAAATDAPDGEPTTTITLHSTVTDTITMYPQATSMGGEGTSPGNGAGASSGGGEEIPSGSGPAPSKDQVAPTGVNGMSSSSDSDCSVAYVTVTTIMKSTITVTKPTAPASSSVMAVSSGSSSMTNGVMPTGSSSDPSFMTTTRTSMAASSTW